MIDYRAGVWGFTVAFGWNGSLAPRALTMAIPNAILTLLMTYWVQNTDDLFNYGENVYLDKAAEAERKNMQSTSASAQMVITAFTSVMIFILYNRSNTAYDRWWEGGTLLQKTRGEWFNAYSSIMAFTSTKPELQAQVDAYVHLLARLMSLLMCCGLQQVSPNRDRPFEIIDLVGIEPDSMEFLNQAPDKVEIILQWIQRSMVLHQHSGVLPVAPPILSRAFQEVSRGIVNLQNARKIADFPYPYPLAQVSMILQLVHFACIPIFAALAAPRVWAVLFSFFSIFVLWCIHFNALDLEFPFGTRVNDLPMHELQQDWNKSICTLLAERAMRPPGFDHEPEYHNDLIIAMSDASDLYIPRNPRSSVSHKGTSVITIARNKTSRQSMKIACAPNFAVGKLSRRRPGSGENRAESADDTTGAQAGSTAGVGSSTEPTSPISQTEPISQSAASSNFHPTSSTATAFSVFGHAAIKEPPPVCLEKPDPADASHRKSNSSDSNKVLPPSLTFSGRELQESARELQSQTDPALRRFDMQQDAPSQPRRMDANQRGQPSEDGRRSGDVHKLSESASTRSVSDDAAARGSNRHSGSDDSMPRRPVINDATAGVPNGPSGQPPDINQFGDPSGDDLSRGANLAL